MLVMSLRPGLFGLVLLRLRGLVLSRGLVLGRGKALFKLVRLGGHQVRKVRGNAADVHDAADVFLYRDSSIALLLDMRRRFGEVIHVLDSMISHGVTLSRSVELTAQWGRILSIGPLHSIVFGDFHAVEGFGLGYFCRVVGDMHRRLSDFIHGVVVCRRDEAIREWRNWLREDPLVHPFKWLSFSPVSASSYSWWLGFLLIRTGLMKNSERLGFPTFAVLGKGIPALRNSTWKLRSGYLCCLSLSCLNEEVDGWLPLLLEVHLPRWLGLEGNEGFARCLVRWACTYSFFG